MLRAGDSSKHRPPPCTVRQVGFAPVDGVGLHAFHHKLLIAHKIALELGGSQQRLCWDVPPNSS